MPLASTKVYDVTYIHFDGIAKLTEITAVMLGIRYNVDSNAFREVFPPVEEGGEETYVDRLSLYISKNGINQVRLELGQVLVWDNNRLYVMSPDEFLARYEPKAEG